MFKKEVGDMTPQGHRIKQIKFPSPFYFLP